MSIETELQALKTEDGRFEPETITEWVRDNPNSELHGHKEYHWGDDSAAAWLHRVNVTRNLIRLHIRTEEGDRGTISLVQDRRTGSGYREIGPVMSNAELRAMALKQAFRELASFRRRYNHLQELAKVFAAADEAQTGQTTAAAA